MAAAVLLCASTLTLAVLTGIGWLAHTLRPRRTRIRITLPAVLSIEVELDTDPAPLP